MHSKAFVFPKNWARLQFHHATTMRILYPESRTYIHALVDGLRVGKIACSLNIDSIAKVLATLACFLSKGVIWSLQVNLCDLTSNSFIQSVRQFSSCWVIIGIREDDNHHYFHSDRINLAGSYGPVSIHQNCHTQTGLMCPLSLS